MARKAKESASVIGDRTYEATKIRDADGTLRTSRGNGDAIAKAMLIHKAAGGTLDEIVKANDLGDKMKPHKDKQEGLKRMTLGVILRALVKNGTPVKIGKIKVERLNQKVEMPKVERKAPAAKKASAPRKRRAKKDQVAQAA